MGLFGKIAMAGGISENFVLMMRFLIAFVVFFPFCIYFKKFRGLHLKDIGICFLFGAVFYFSHSFLFFKSLNHISTGLTGILFYFYPIVIVFLNFIFYRKKPGLLSIVAIGISLVGIYLLSDIKGLGVSELGWHNTKYIILCAIFYASYVVIGEKLVVKINPAAISLFIFLGASCSFSLYTFATSSFPESLATNQLMSMVALGIISTCIAILFLFFSIRILGSFKCSMVSVLEPVVTIFLGVIYFKESFSFIQSFGVILVLLAVFIILFDRKKATVEESLA